MLGLAFLGIYYAIPNAEFSFNYILFVTCMLLVIFGYIGLLLLLKGLYKTNHIKKLTLLLCGLIGFLVFMLEFSPRNFIDWLVKSNIESMIGKWPLIVCLTFCLLIIHDLTGNKNKATNEINTKAEQ